MSDWQGQLACSFTEIGAFLSVVGTRGESNSRVFSHKTELNDNNMLCEMNRIQYDRNNDFGNFTIEIPLEIEACERRSLFYMTRGKGFQW